jgi:hypothetical protein
MEDILKIFQNSQESLSHQIPQSFSSQFTEEIMKSVFNASKRDELCLNEEDIVSMKRSDRGFSIDEEPEIQEEEVKDGNG